MGNRSGWLCLLVAGCGGPGVQTTREAPFEVRSIRSALWSVASASDAQNQAAVLVLSDDRIDCAAIDGEALDPAIDQLTRNGSGFVFLLEQTVADGGAVLEWPGTWTSDGGSLPGSASWGSRSLGVSAFETGVLYDITSDPTDWLRLDDVGEGRVVGEFWTTWWRGAFKAETCGDWETPDTGSDPTTL